MISDEELGDLEKWIEEVPRRMRVLLAETRRLRARMIKHESAMQAAITQIQRERDEARAELQRIKAELRAAEEWAHDEIQSLKKQMKKDWHSEIGLEPPQEKS
jgi:hypothetical protein